MKLVTNTGEGHRVAIGSALDGCTEALVAVAFLKAAGASFLCGLLRSVLEDGGRARVFIGTDFFLTEPEALQTLLDLASRQSGLEVSVGSRAGATFHPKTYAGFGPGGLRCLVGSANLTGGALGANIETSILVEAGLDTDFADQVRAMFGSLAADGRFAPLDALALAAYRSIWRPVEKERAKLDRVIGEADLGSFDLGLLEELHRQYLADPANLAEAGRRQSNRKKARAVQRRIAALVGSTDGKASRDRTLATLLRDLMSSRDGALHLWSSGDIHRRGSEVLRHPKRTLALFAEAERASTLPVDAGYGALRDIAEPLPGAGINMVTEILSTYAPDRFAVVNGNTVAALAHLGLTFTGSRSLGLKTVKPARYVEIVGLIAAVRERIGATDFPETDAFLNWVYQQI
jgi:HKD family nuclease